MAIGTARTYRKLRYSVIAILVIHLILRKLTEGPSVFGDLFLYNAIAVGIAVVAFVAPTFNDHYARVSISGALFLWAIGSISTTWNSFFEYQVWPNFSDLCYIAFYPLLLFGLIRALTAKRQFRFTELLDVFIITFGFTTMIAALFLKSAMKYFDGTTTSVFLSIVYPIGDVVLFAIGVVVVLAQRRALRSLIFMAGLAIFATTDLYFLYTSATSTYAFASITDDGWLLGLLLISEALWHHGGEIKISDQVISGATTFAMIFCGGVLALSSVKAISVNSIALYPAIFTVTLAVARMGFALHQARTATENMELARIDELTGLANRRKFLQEIEKLGEQTGTVLLMDLDGFKVINDSLGHAAGDELLRQLSLRFSRVVPHGALLARLGGDEFGVVIPGGVRQGHEVAMALTSTVTYPFVVDGRDVTVGVSIGRVINDGSAELLQRADAAMYSAKRSGGGMVLWQS